MFSFVCTFFFFLPFKYDSIVRNFFFFFICRNLIYLIIFFKIFFVAVAKKPKIKTFLVLHVMSHLRGRREFGTALLSKLYIIFTHMYFFTREYIFIYVCKYKYICICLLYRSPM